jgi:hypothetical protein
MLILKQQITCQKLFLCGFTVESVVLIMFKEKTDTKTGRKLAIYALF